MPRHMDGDRALSGTAKEDAGFLKAEAICTVTKCLSFLIWKIWACWIKQLAVTTN